MKIIRCNSIVYRKDYIEIAAGIHDNCVNVEVTNIHPDKNIANLNLTDKSISDENITDNTEIELSLSEAEQLIDMLKTAISITRYQES